MFHSGVHCRTCSFLVRAHEYEIFLLAIRCLGAQNRLGRRTMRRRHHLIPNSALAVEYVDGRKVSRRCQLASEHYVTVEYGARCVGNWFVEIVAIHQHRVNASDAADTRIARALEKTW